MNNTEEYKMKDQLFTEAIIAVRTHKNAVINNREEYEKSYKPAREAVEKWARYTGLEYKQAVSLVMELI